MKKEILIIDDELNFISPIYDYDANKEIIMEARKYLPLVRQAQHIRDGDKVYRNDMCICGSEKKYKRCCQPNS